MIKAIFLFPLRVYSRFISPVLPPRCKYHPTCSAYAVQSVERFGILRGSVLAGWRILRCNPWSHGGYDPPDDAFKRIFRRTPSPPSPSSPSS